MTANESGKFQLIPVDDIDLDLENPRIARFLEMYQGEITAEQVSLALGYGSSDDGAGGPSFTALRQSILTNGGVIHPIIVNRKKNGKLVVIEGNTRTLIYRELAERKADSKWDKIPAMVHENLSEETVDSIRLQAHLVGTRDWDPYSKAKYLNYLRDKEHLPFSQIVDFCGGDNHEVETYIKAFNDMEDYYRHILESENDFDPSRFSAFVELQRPKVIQSLMERQYSKKDFSQWVHDRKIHPLATVRKLPRILQHDKSRDVFLESGAQEAIKVLNALEAGGEGLSLEEASLVDLARALTRKWSNIKFSEVQKLKNDPDPADRDTLCDSRDVLQELCDEIAGEG
ncbi:ParB N-terminal domain-containing protein [Fibrobacterota bacterium]